MPEQPQYVAVRPLKFGGVALQPGDPIPFEKGRSYHQMLSLGQIALAPAAGTVIPEGAHQVLLHPDSPAIFVDQDGVPEEVTYLGTQQPDEEAREILQLEPGEQAALVQFDLEPEPVLVPLGSLISGEAVQRLIDGLKSSAQLTALQPWALHEGAMLIWVHDDGSHELLTFLRFEAVNDQETAARVQRVGEGEPHELLVGLTNLLPGEAATRLLAFEQARVAQTAEQGLQTSETNRAAADVQVQALQGQVAFLELLLRAIRTEGEALPADFPALKELAVNGVTTRQGLELLAEGEQGKAHLQGLDGIGAKRADQILAALAGTPEPPEGSDDSSG